MSMQELIGHSSVHLTILEKLTKIAPTDAEVLITGPSGVGKELYAKYIHEHSNRKSYQFVPINCGCLSNELLQNELFGHVGGAFTSARTQTEGLVKEAEGGTLFFDEVDSLSMPCQTMLLRFLQDKQYRRMGENCLRQANIRIISATNANLEDAVTQNRFRKDLFFRLRVAPIHIPALCSRPEDIIELLTIFIQRSAEKYNLPPITFHHAALERLETYEWPGNIRELENCVNYLTCLQLQHPVEPSDLPLLQEIHTKNVTDSETNYEHQATIFDISENFQATKKQLITNFEKQRIQQALDATGGNISAAARMIGKNRRALFELIRKYEINPADYRISSPQREDCMPD